LFEFITPYLIIRIQESWFEGCEFIPDAGLIRDAPCKHVNIFTAAVLRRNRLRSLSQSQSQSRHAGIWLPRGMFNDETWARPSWALTDSPKRVG
jgi:hypothetical protein